MIRLICAAIFIFNLSTTLYGQVAEKVIDQNTQNNQNQEELLVDFIKHGLKNAFEIKKQVLRFEQEQNSQKNSFYQFFPTLSAGFSRNHSHSESFVNNKITGVDGTVNSAYLGASWTIWDNYQNIRNYEKSNINLKSESINTDNINQQYIINLIELFFSYHLLVFQKQITQQYADQSVWALEKSMRMVSLGAQTELESMDSQIQLDNARRDLIEIENSLLNAKRDIQFMLNDRDFNQVPEYDLFSANPYFLKNWINKIEEIKSGGFEKIKDKNPNLKLNFLSITAAELDFKQAKMNYFPQLSANISFNRNLSGQVEESTADDQTDPTNSYSLSFNATWTFWDWWSTPRNINNASKSFEIARLSLLENLYRQENAFVVQMNQWDVLEESLETSYRILDAAKKQLNYNEEMYRIGKIPLIELQRAQTRLFSAQKTIADRIKEKNILAAKLLFQTGEIITP